MKEEHIACRCTVCQLINVVPSGWVDGQSCMECGSMLVQIGHAKVKNTKRKPYSNMIINVEVKTKSLDEALEKARELHRLTKDM